MHTCENNDDHQAGGRSVHVVQLVSTADMTDNKDWEAAQTTDSV